jgi:predicted alpha/beta superfamily hydrolase
LYLFFNKLVNNNLDNGTPIVIIVCKKPVIEIMKQSIQLLFCVLAIIFINLQNGHAQVKGPAQTFMDKEVVYYVYHSVNVGDDYTIYVHVPPGYDTTKIKYPVLYLTDGDWDKNVAINSFNMLRQDYIINEAVIVGIGYGERANQRDRDLDPSKGSANFLAFIEKELIPFIESKYRVTDNRTLSGYSRGGEFAAYVLFNRPGLFNTVCIGAPADNDNLVPNAQKYFADHKDLKARIFLGAGAYEHETVDNIALFNAYLLKQNCKDLEVEMEIIPHASHGAAKPPVIQDGIEFAFCIKHKAIALTADELEKYTGIYDQTGNPGKTLKVYIENNRLYFVGDRLPYEVTPFTKDGFFQYGSEKAAFIFKAEDGKMKLFYVPYNGKPELGAERLLSKQ